jgi:transposase
MNTAARQQRRRNGITRPLDCAARQQRRDKVIAGLLAGASVGELAAQTGLAESTITLIAYAHGIRTRSKPRGEMTYRALSLLMKGRLTISQIAQQLGVTRQLIDQHKAAALRHGIVLPPTPNERGRRSTRLAA